MLSTVSLDNRRCARISNDEISAQRQVWPVLLNGTDRDDDDGVLRQSGRYLRTLQILETTTCIMRSRIHVRTLVNA